jgi:hypothetical protein
MKRIILLLTIFFLAIYQQTFSQGCVAIRGNGNSCSMMHSGNSNGWEFSFNTRYFKSYKHFVGTIEQKQRVEQQTQVVNKAFAWDLVFTKHLNARWSIAADVPVLSFIRSSLYEHSNTRHSTHSFGLGDARVTAYRWIFDPATSHKGNLQAGLGLKLPTGDYNYQDFFYKADSTTVLGPVDQSIQPGDGGLGLATELNGYYNFSFRVGVYGNGYYLINPREQNGTSNKRGGTPTANDLKYFTSTMSVPDQYMIRFGMNYQLRKLTLSGGFRMEGIPSSDLVGGDKGFRRPGYVMSAEPVVAYRAKMVNLYFSMPWAFHRNRTQSYSDKLKSADTGTHVQGDAAFADYTINFGVSFSLK